MPSWPAALMISAYVVSPSVICSMSPTPSLKPTRFGHSSASRPTVSSVNRALARL
jgi:hypothetical protein